MSTTPTTQPFWRQGDIYFVKVNTEPSFLTATPLKAGVIARGEQTGHMHRVAESSLANGAALVLRGQSMYLRAPEAGATIVHDEHEAIELPMGLYEVVNQQEFDGLRWRAVLD